MAYQQVWEIFQALAHTIGQLSTSIGNQGHTQQVLTAQVKHLSNSVGTQSVAQFIPTFRGNPKEFQEWIKAVEKYAVFTNAIANAVRIKLIAYQSCKGAVIDCTKRYLSAYDSATRVQCKTHITARFSEVTDPQHAFLLLRQLNKNKVKRCNLFGHDRAELLDDFWVNNKQI